MADTATPTLYLLDRLHCQALLLERRAPVLAALRALPEGSELGTTALVLGELLALAAQSAQPQANRELAIAFSHHLHLYALDHQTAEIYGQIAACPEAASVALPEAWLVSAARQHHCTLLAASAAVQRLAQAQAVPTACWLAASFET